MGKPSRIEWPEVSRQVTRRGYGPGFRAWIGEHAKGMSRGNGAAMRTSPWAWMAYPWEEMLENVSDVPV